MKNYKLITSLFLLFLFYSSVSFPNVLYEMTTPPKKSPLWEIKAILEDPLISIEEDTEVMLVFSLSEGRKLKIKSIETPNEDIEKIFQTKLEDKIIQEKRIIEGTIYEVTISLKGCDVN